MTTCFSMLTITNGTVTCATLCASTFPIHVRCLNWAAACGKFGPKFSMDDYEIYGMDKSISMLSIAKTRSYKNFHIFCCGDITRFALSKPIDFIFSVHDTFNYLLTYDDFAKALRCAYNCMSYNSIFLFDITTQYNIMKNFHRRLFSYTVKGTDITWYNEYDEKSKMVYTKLTFATLKPHHY